MSTTTTTYSTTHSTTTATDDRHLELALADLAAGRPSTAVSRALRIAREELAERIDAHNEARRTQNEIRKLATAQRQQARREAIAAARRRYWGARV